LGLFGHDMVCEVECGVRHLIGEVHWSVDGIGPGDKVIHIHATMDLEDMMTGERGS